MKQCNFAVLSVSVKQARSTYGAFT